MTVNTANPYPTAEIEEIKTNNYIDKKLHFITRQQEISKKKDYLEREYSKYNKLNKRCGKYKNVEYLSTTLMAFGVTFATTGTLTNLTGYMTVVGIPATIIGISSSGASALTQVFTKYVHKKEVKYVILKEKSYQISKEFNRVYHKSMQDNNIDETEYDTLMSKYDEYIQFKNNTKKENKLIFEQQQLSKK